MEESKQGYRQGQEGLDHSSNQGAGKQQAGSRGPCPGKHDESQPFEIPSNAKDR